MNIDTELQRAVDAADRAAELLAASFTADAGVQSQPGRDIKTRADVEAEACILEQLSPSDIPILAEESAAASTATDGLRWLVDPLDGTMNFSRGFPISAVSIGLWEGANPILGVIYDLNRNTMYTGIVGEGAWRDGKSIAVSTIADPSQAVLTTGFPVGQDLSKASLEAFMGRVQTFKKIRMIGSAALSLAYVAEGAFDAYYEENIMIWDIAAGVALVTAAGGKVTTLPGTKPHAFISTATNGHLTV